MWIENFLILNSAQILLTKGQLESGQIASMAAVVKQEEARKSDDEAEDMPDIWHRTYTTIKSLPKYYLADWLVKGPAKMSKRMTDNIDANDPANGIRLAFEFLTGLGPNTWWAPALHRRMVLTAWLQEHFPRVGGPERSKVLKGAVDSAGRIDVPKLLPFNLKYTKQYNEEDLETMSASQLPMLKEISHRFFKGSKVAMEFNFGWDSCWKLLLHLLELSR